MPSPLSRSMVHPSVWACLFALSALALADPITEHFPEAAQSGCMKCHAGIELIREPGSEMMRADHGTRARRWATRPAASSATAATPTRRRTRTAAHGGKDFYPDPGSPWINEQTCGQCHPKHVDVQWHSLMMTEAGKIQGVCWAFGSLTGLPAPLGQLRREEPRGPRGRDWARRRLPGVHGAAQAARAARVRRRARAAARGADQGRTGQAARGPDAGRLHLPPATSASAATTRSRAGRRAATIAAWAARPATSPTATRDSTRAATRRSPATTPGHMPGPLDPGHPRGEGHRPRATPTAAFRSRPAPPATTAASGSASRSRA